MMLLLFNIINHVSSGFDCRAQQIAASKSTVKKEKNTKDKMKATEASSQSAAVDDHSKSTVDMNKNENEKSKDTTSEPASDKSELHGIQLASHQTLSH